MLLALWLGFEIVPPWLFINTFRFVIMLTFIRRTSFFIFVMSNQTKIVNYGWQTAGVLQHADFEFIWNPNEVCELCPEYVWRVNCSIVTDWQLTDSIEVSTATSVRQGCLLSLFTFDKSPYKFHHPHVLSCLHVFFFFKTRVCSLAG